jgi:hypothetical protein
MQNLPLKSNNPSPKRNDAKISSTVKIKEIQGMRKNKRLLWSMLRTLHQLLSLIYIFPFFSHVKKTNNKNPIFNRFFSSFKWKMLIFLIILSYFSREKMVSTTPDQSLACILHFEKRYQLLHTCVSENAEKPD